MHLVGWFAVQFLTDIMTGWKRCSITRSVTRFSTFKVVSIINYSIMSEPFVRTYSTPPSSSTWNLPAHQLFQLAHDLTMNCCSRRLLSKQLLVLFRACLDILYILSIVLYSGFYFSHRRYYKTLKRGSDIKNF